MNAQLSKKAKFKEAAQVDLHKPLIHLAQEAGADDPVQSKPYEPVCAGFLQRGPNMVEGQYIASAKQGRVLTCKICIDYLLVRIEGVKDAQRFVKTQEAFRSCQDRIARMRELLPPFPS